MSIVSTKKTLERSLSRGVPAVSNDAMTHKHQKYKPGLVGTQDMSAFYLRKDYRKIRNDAGPQSNLNPHDASRGQGLSSVGTEGLIGLLSSLESKSYNNTNDSRLAYLLETDHSVKALDLSFFRDTKYFPRFQVLSDAEDCCSTITHTTGSHNGRQPLETPPAPCGKAQDHWCVLPGSPIPVHGPNSQSPTLAPVSQNSADVMDIQGAHSLGASGPTIPLLSKPAALITNKHPFTQESKVAEKLINEISSILRCASRREALLRLRGSSAQYIIDFLDSALQTTDAENWLRRHMTIVLYQLCKATNLYPKCYILDNITLDPEPEDGGAFSDIFKGRHPKSKKILCVKIIRIHKSDMDLMLKVYAKEAVLWRQLSHPAIVPFYGVFYQNALRKKVCLVSPWMKNGNLSDYLSLNPNTEREPLVYDIALGLSYMHTERVVHGDLKGPNILVDDSGRACITDFGLSSLRTSNTLPFSIKASTVLGCSYRWSAPEVLLNAERPTLESDIWSFGCVCYEILFRKRPFHECSTDAEVVIKMTKGNLPGGNFASPFMPTRVSDIFQDLVARSWATEPQGRPSAQVIVAELGLISGIGRKAYERVQDYTLRDGQQLRKAVRGNVEMADLAQVQQILSQFHL